MVTPVAHSGGSGLADVLSAQVMGALVVLLLVVLYVHAIRRLRRRGRDIPSSQQLAFWTAVALLLAGLVGPIASMGEDLLLAHMAQHLLIADLAAPLLLIGLRTPVLVFMWPKVVMVPVARSSILRAMGSWVTRPAVSLILWLGTLLFWHIPPMFHAAVQNMPIHLVQHATFWATAVIAWWPLLDPSSRRVDSPVWKAAHVFVARMVGGLLGVSMIAFPFQIYAGAYGGRSRAYGIDPVLDQQIAGTMMMTLDFIIIVAGFMFFMIRSSVDHDADYASVKAPDEADAGVRDAATLRPHASPVR